MPSRIQTPSSSGSLATTRSHHYSSNGMSNGSTSNTSNTSNASSPNSSTSSSPLTTGHPEARAALLTALTQLGNAQTARLHERARDIHHNSSRLATQETQIANATRAVGRERSKLESQVNAHTKALNGFGDLQNWAEVLEREFCVLEETVRLVEGGAVGGGDRGESGGSLWRGE